MLTVARRRLTGGLPSSVSGTILLTGTSKPLAYGTRLWASIAHMHRVMVKNAYNAHTGNYGLGGTDHRAHDAPHNAYNAMRTTQ